MSRKPQSQQLDLFVLPLADVDLRDQQDTMESPFFALNKGRKTPLEYGNPKGNIYVKVSPNVSHSMATIWDADILIWAAGTINRMQRQGDAKALAELDQTRTLHFHPVDLLRSIKRGTGGKDIQELRAALDRLATTYIQTNIREHHQGRDRRQGFTWIEGWSEVTADKPDGGKRTLGFSLTLSNWFYMGIVHQRLLLTMEPEYFNLTGGYERWLYRIARKHAHGTPEGWSFTLGTLHQKSGSDAPKKAFKRDLKRLAGKGEILGYGIDWQERGRGEDPLIRLYALPDNERNQQLAQVHHRKALTKAANEAVEAVPEHYAPLLAARTLTRLAIKYPSIDLQDALTRFIAWNGQRGTIPARVVPAFEGFLRRDGRGKGE